MRPGFLQSPLLRFHLPWWIPFVSLFLVLYGIVFLDWHLQPIIFMFWWEVILMVGAALVRMLFALDGKGILSNIMLKIMLLMGGIVMGGTMITFAIVFSFKVFEGETATRGMENIRIQTNLLTISYLTGLVFHYFLNDRYKEANPAGELVSTLGHLLILLALLQTLTMHLIPKYPQLDQALWVAVSVVLLKFGTDFLFMRYRTFIRSIGKDPE